MEPAAAAPELPRSPLHSPAAALAILTLINLFNYIDRYVISAIQPRIKDALALSDGQLGVLSSSFIVVYMLTSPFFGRLGDTGSRRGLIALGVSVWSLATASAGLARSFGEIFMARAAVGIGEAAYGTISPSLLADFFPPEKRGRVFAVFFAAIPIGSALGYVLGGVVEAHFGWRWAFFIVGLPGLLLAATVFALREPPRGGQDGGARPPGHGHGPVAGGALQAYLGCLRIRAYTMTVLGYAAYTFALGGLAIWMPTFLERVRGVALERANFVFGGMTVVSGFLGTFAGGFTGDRLLARGVRQPYLLVSGLATALAIPAAAAALLLPGPGSFYPAIFLAELLLFVSTGPINAVIVDVVPPERRATAVALSILAIHLLGDAISPPIIGFASDRLGLETAVMIVPVAVAVAAAIWTAAALTGPRSRTPDAPADAATPA